MRLGRACPQGPVRPIAVAINNILWDKKSRKIVILGENSWLNTRCSVYGMGATPYLVVASNKAFLYILGFLIMGTDAKVPIVKKPRSGLYASSVARCSSVGHRARCSPKSPNVLWPLPRCARHKRSVWRPVDHRRLTSLHKSVALSRAVLDASLNSPVTN